MSKTGTHRVRYRSGDVFQIPFPDGKFGYGRILLDVFRLRRKGVFDKRSSLNGSCGSGLLVQVYRRTFEKPLTAVQDLRRVPLFLDFLLAHDQIYRAEFPILGNLPVIAADISFPEFVIGDYHERWFEKGGIVVDIAISFEDSQDLPKPSFSLGIAQDWVLENIRKPSGRRRLTGGDDLRVDRRRKHILNLAGLLPAMSYDEMCAKVGGPTAKELLAIEV